MEKRLFLAIFLSIAVVFVFQSVFAPKARIAANETPQDIDNRELASYKPVSDNQIDLPKPTNKIDFTEEFIVIKLDGIEVELTNKGGNVRSISLVNLNYQMPVKNYLNIPAFENNQFSLQSSMANEAIYTFVNDQWKITKTYRIKSDNTLSCRLDLLNISSGNLSLIDNIQAFVVDLSILDKKGVNSSKSSDWTLSEYAIQTDKSVFRKSNIQNLNDRWNKEEVVPVHWFGFRDHYFATIAKPGFVVGKYVIKAVSNKELAIGTTISNLNIPSGQGLNYEEDVFIGPQKPEILKAAGPGYEKIMVFSDWAWLDAISKAIYWLLGAIHKIIPVWGFCIIIISLIVYGLMYPLTLKSLTSMRKMQVLQPKIKAIQEKHSKSPEKMNQEVMQLYRQHGVNPLGGCLPMLLQMPIFVGLYQVLWRSVNFRGEGFLWIKDLSMPDHLFKFPFTVPFLGEYFNIFPVLMVIIMALQQRFSMKNMVVTDPEQVTQQKMMATFLPVLMGVIFYNFASGLNLYFVVFYILSAFTQWKIAKDNQAT